MKIQPVYATTFKRRLKPGEEADYTLVLNRGKALTGNSGKSILIIPSPSLPQDKSCNTGVGNILDKTSLDFFDFAKKYWGINCIQDLPNGNFAHSGEIWKPYSGTSFDLGSQLINLKLLPKELVNDKYLNRLIQDNINFDKVVYENVLNKDSDAENILKDAYKNLLKADTDSKKSMLKEIEAFESENKSWLEPKSIFKSLEKKYNTSNIEKWSKVDKNLYNTDIVSIENREQRIAEIKKENPFEAGYYKFKQFLADKHLRLAKEELNKKGIELSGDFLSGNSYDEVWMRPKAFIQNAGMYWGFPALDLDSKEGQDFLKEKARLYAKRYDNIRIDAAWTYVNQPLKYNGSSVVNQRKYYGDKILKIIEAEIQAVKGENYKPENIMYEFIANSEDFNAYDSNRKLNPILEKRNKIYCSNNLSPHQSSTTAFREMNWNPDFYVLGTTNHDQMPMKLKYAAPGSREAQANILSEILNIPKEKISDLKEFIKAKFAEPMRAKNNMIFFLDALNLDGMYKDNPNPQKDYRTKIPVNYQDKYFESLAQGEGYNPMDALEKAFRAEGLDKKEPELYKKIVKYRRILEQPCDTVLKSRIIKGVAAAIAVCLVTFAAVKYHTNKKEPAVSQPA